MTLAHVVAFNIALFAALISPGPALFMTLRASLSGGRNAGVAVGAGLGAMAALWTLAALLGLDALFALFPWAYTALKLVGGAYLLWIAMQTWRGAHAALDTSDTSQARSFLSGFLVNLGNPKSVLFAAAVLVVIFPPNLTLPEILLIATNHMLVELVFYAAVAIALSTAPARAGYLRLKPAFDRIAAGIMGGLGLRLIFERS